LSIDIRRHKRETDETMDSPCTDLFLKPNLSSIECSKIWKGQHLMHF